MELAVNDLRHHIKSWNKPVPLRCVQSVSQQALSAIAYLHEKNITHRDLKEENILVTKWDSIAELPTIKLADFGLVSVQSNPTSLVGTKGWMAPEIAEEWAKVESRIRLESSIRSVSNIGLEYNTQAFQYTNSVDIYSMGKIIKKLLGDVQLTKRSRRPLELANELSSQMMQKDPKARPTAAHCLQNPWIRFAENPKAITKRERSSSPTASGAHKRVLGPQQV